MGAGAQEQRAVANHSGPARLRFGPDRQKRGTREIRTSDLATHLFAEPAPGPHAPQRILNEAALKPKLIAQYAAKWPGGRPGDDSCIGERAGLALPRQALRDS
jgi:hypothetical protein